MPVTGLPIKESIHLPDLLQRGLAAHPEEAALVSREASWTWRELDETSDRLAANLLGLGLAAGDRVASLMPNRAVLVVHYIACIKAGLVATPLNYRYMAPEIDHALAVSGASVLVHHAERDRDVAQSSLAQALPLGVVRYRVRDGKGPSLEELMAREAPATDLGVGKPADPAFIFFTSGSTGRPKGVTHSIETFGALIASSIDILSFTPQDVVLPGSSLSHVGALGLSLTGIAAGSRVLIARTFDGDELLPLMREERPTFLCMLPAALFGLVRDHGATRDDFRSFRLCVAGGDKVSGELEREFTELAGFPIEEGYGMTEIGFATLNPVGGVNKIGSVGVVSAGFAASIRDENGAELPTGAEGRLWIKAPSNMVGYWNNPTATAETIVAGWLDTGDVMKVDEDGYLWFCGRKKQIIIHDGSNISPQEVEEVLLEHPAVAGAGVVGIHDLVHGEIVRAYLTLKSDAERPKSQELIRFARERIGYKAPEEIVVLSEIPLNATGKVDRVKLKAMAEKR